MHVSPTWYSDVWHGVLTRERGLWERQPWEVVGGVCVHDRSERCVCVCVCVCVRIVCDSEGRVGCGRWG